MEKKELIDTLYDVSIKTFHDKLHYNCFELGITRESIDELINKVIEMNDSGENDLRTNILKATTQQYKNILADEFKNTNMMVNYVKHYRTISDPHGCVKRNMMTSLIDEFDLDVDWAINDGLAQSITIDLANNIEITLKEDYNIYNSEDLNNQLLGSNEINVLKGTKLDERTVDRINYHNRQVYNEFKEQGGVSTYFKLADDIENKIYDNGGLNYNLIGDLDIVEYNCTPMDFAQKYEENPHYNDYQTLNNHVKELQEEFEDDYEEEEDYDM